MMRLRRRYIISCLDNLELSKPIRYERYYINDNLRVQKKGNTYQKEILDNENNIIEKLDISEIEFLELRQTAYSEIIRDSYLFLGDYRISIKQYYGKYEGLYRVEIEFKTEDEMNNYMKEKWMNEDITDSPLAFDRELSKLSEMEFREELSKYI